MSAYGLTPYQRSFALNVINGDNPSEALVNSEYKTDNMTPATIAVQAQKLLNHPNISLMIRESQERTAKKVEYTLEKALEYAMEDREQAKELGQMGAANAANKLAAELMGMLNHKQTLKLEVDPWEQILDIVDGKSRDLSQPAGIDMTPETKH